MKPNMHIIKIYFLVYLMILIRCYKFLHAFQQIQLNLEKSKFDLRQL